jgi:hypothetical protein
MSFSKTRETKPIRFLLRANPLALGPEIATEFDVGEAFAYKRNAVDVGGEGISEEACGCRWEIC